MKFIHISDLHIGKSVNGFSMLDEQRRAFEQITGYIKTESPDAVLIAGDVYDRAVPGTEAVRVFDDFLTALAREGVSVMLISGNHDSPERLSFASRLLADKRLHICGTFDGKPSRVTLADELGDVNFWLLPFIRPSSLRGIYDSDADESYNGAFDAVLNAAFAAAIEAAGVDYSARNVLVSHQFFTKAGVTPVRSESELNPVGGLDAIDAALIEKFDYAALGHLHGAQTAGAAHIRYAGSPVKYSFSEWRQKKSASLVELREKGDISVTILPLVPLHDMREIKGNLDKLISGEVSLLADRNDYIRAILTDEEEIADPIGKLRSAYPNIMSLEFENIRTNIDVSAIKTDAVSVETLSRCELFGEFFLETQGAAMSGEQAEIVRELLEREGAL